LIYRLNEKYQWDSFILGSNINIDTSEIPGSLCLLDNSDEFNNLELSSELWNIITNTNIKYIETTLLDIIATASSSTFKIKQTIAMPSLYLTYIDFSERNANGYCSIILSDTTNTYEIKIANTITVLKNSVLQATIVRNVTSGRLYIAKSSETHWGIYLVSNNITSVIYTTALVLSDEYLSIEVGGSSLTSGTICKLSNLIVDGITKAIGTVSYEIKTLGKPLSVYYDGYVGPNQYNYFQLSADNTNWYGANGLNTLLDATTKNIPLLPDNTLGKYYMRIFLVPAQWASFDNVLAYSTYLEQRGKLDTILAQTRYNDILTPLPTVLALSNFSINYSKLSNILAYTDYKTHAIFYEINEVDTIVRLYAMTLTNDSFPISFIPTKDMEYLAIYGDYTGTLLYEIGTDLYLLQPGKLILVPITSSSVNITFKTLTTCVIQHLTVFGVWI